MAKTFKVIRPGKPLECNVEIPGSKSITNRALLLSVLSDRPVRLSNVLFSDDGRYFIECLQKLGFRIDSDPESKTVRIFGLGGKIPNRKASIYVGSAGTAARFLTAMLALSEGEFTLDASAQMKARPMKPLLDALTALGAKFEYLEQVYCLPYRIRGTGYRGSRVKLAANISSQFLSALLLAGCYGPEDLEIEIDGEVAAKPYVAMTLRMMRQFGVTVENDSYQRFIIPKGQHYRGLDYTIEPDLSNACYFWTMAVLTGGTVLVNGSKLNSLQGDIKFLNVLERLGAKVQETPDGVMVQGPKGGKFPGIEVDLGDTPDQTMTLAALAPFADGPTIIRNVELIKYHESNRLQAIVTELTRLGIAVRETDDGLEIFPGMPKPGRVETYDDHRMAMAFALLGLRADGIEIDNPDCTAKTFAGYFEVFDRIVRGSSLDNGKCIITFKPVSG